MTEYRLLQPKPCKLVILSFGTESSLFNILYCFSNVIDG